MTAPIAVTLPFWLTFLSSITFLSDAICSSKIVCKSSLVQCFPHVHWLAVWVYEILSIVVVQWQERWGNYGGVCPLVSLQCVAVVNAASALLSYTHLSKKVRKKGSNIFTRKYVDAPEVATCFLCHPTCCHVCFEVMFHYCYCMIKYWEYCFSDCSSAVFNECN